MTKTARNTTAIATAQQRIDVLCLSDSHGALDNDWLAHLRQRLPDAVLWARPALAAQHQLKAVDLAGSDPRGWLGHFPDGALVLRSGLRLPDYLIPRLRAHQKRASAGVLVLPGNHHPALNPVAGLPLHPDTKWSGSGLDSLVAATALGRAHALRSPIGDALMLTGRGAGVTIVDNIWVHDPAQALNGGEFNAPAVRHALGDLRLRLLELLNGQLSSLPYFGLDGLPVTLHISHSWGGGIKQWVSDQCAAVSNEAHALVLSSHGANGDFEHGQALALFAAGPDQGRLHQWLMAPAISSTAVHHPQYDQCLKWLIGRYGVTGIMVSSLIGHSLDALRQPLATAQVLHDVYPASPILDVDPLQHLSPDHQLDLQSALAASTEPLKFSTEDLNQWPELRQAWQQTVTKHQTALIAPTQHVAKRWLELFDQAIPEPSVIPHGFDSSWAHHTTPIPAQARADGKLNVVVIGRISGGKGDRWLLQRAEALTQHAHLTLLGAGQRGLQFIGKAGIDVVMNYDLASLPEMVSEIKPQAALFLSTVPETWNYVLSEVRALGLTPIAPDLGSFAERIKHGEDGLLYSLHDSSLIDLLAALKENPTLIPKPAAVKEPSLAESQAHYAQLLDRILKPTTQHPTQSLSNEPPSFGGGQDAQAQLADLLLQHADQAADFEKLQQELSTRTNWAQRQERIATERTQWAKRLDQQLEERTIWAQQLDTELESVQQARELLQLQRDQLQDEIAIMVSSRSWRLTRPLRFVSRVMRNITVRRAWHPLLWPRIAPRLVHRLRTYGLRPTLEALQYGGPQIGPVPLTTMPTPVPPSDGQPLTPIVWETSATAPDASVIIPVYNNIHYTAACLHSIVAHAGQRSFEIVVVDDCSNDGSAEYLSACSGITVIRNERNSGFIASCNHGAAAAAGNTLVFLNNDTTVTPGWLDALLETFELFPEAGAVGAKLVYPDGRLQEAGGIIFSDGSGWNYGRLDHPHKPEFSFASAVDYVSGACLAVPRALFEELGGFDDHYAPAYYEDTDLCFRLEAAGYQVIMQPTCVVIHHEGISSGTSEASGIKRYQAVNRDKFRERWRDRLSRQPEPVAGPQDIEAVDAARFRRCIGHVLIIDATLPEPDHDSGSMRMVAMLELWRELGYRVTFVAANLSWSDRYSTALQRRGIEVLHHPMIASIEQWLMSNGHRLDLVMVSRHYILQPLHPMIRKACPSAKLIFDTVDLHYLREQRKAELEDSAAMARMAAQTKTAELKLIANSDITLVVSEVERALLADDAPGADVRILSNIHEPQPEGPNWAARHGVLFVGGFQHPPNVDAAHWLIEEILPGLCDRLPGVMVHLIGSRMPDSIKQARRPGLQVHGYVEDLSPFLNGCRVSVAPLRYGAGVKGKVNQAMACGLPVVATSCAAEGLHATSGTDLLIADSAEAFIEQVVRLHTDRELWETLAVNGRANIAKHFSRQAARQQLQAMLD
jgi:GT2 family glycosyltransferase